MLHQTQSTTLHVFLALCVPSVLDCAMQKTIMSDVSVWRNMIVDWTDPNMLHCSIMLWFGSTNERSRAYAACFSEVLWALQIGFVGGFKKQPTRKWSLVLSHSSIGWRALFDAAC